MSGSQKGVSITVVDVGKGDCILVQSGGSSILIDTGYEETSGKVVSYLRDRGISRLDWLVITHYDKDHVGGLRFVGKALDIGMVYLPGYEGADKNYRTAMETVSELGLSAQRVTEEKVLKLGDARLTILPSSLTYIPNAKGKEGNDDDLSLVATLVFGNDSFLFAADLEEKGIEAYLKRRQGTFDVLKMPDHGKKSGNSDEFLADVSPKVAIITDAADDPADKKTLKLLKNAGADVYRTSTCGTVVVESTGVGSYSVTVEDS